MKIKNQLVAELKLNEPLFYVEEVSDNNLEITVSNVINAVVNNEDFFTTYINKNNETIAQIKINKDYQVIFEEQELPIFVKLENAENYLNEGYVSEKLNKIFFETYKENNYKL